MFVASLFILIVCLPVWSVHNINAECVTMQNVFEFPSDRIMALTERRDIYSRSSIIYRLDLDLD